MLITILLLALVICCWLFFKSIDWFEKIWRYHDRIIHYFHRSVCIHGVCTA